MSNDGKQVTIMPPRSPRLPRDASISFDQHPLRLFICMTITKAEHIDALWDVLQHYAQQLADD